MSIWQTARGCARFESRSSAARPVSNLVAFVFALPVLTAAASGQYAYEVSGARHALFTAAILDALRDPEADTNGDGLIELSELVALCKTMCPSLPRRPGEAVGNSGCGKSTLLRAISGLDPPTLGQVILDATTVTAPHKKIGIVFQEPRLLPWLSIADNVGFGLKNLSKSPSGNFTLRARALQFDAA